VGQKVSPVGLRIGINKDWESKWYAGNKEFSKFLLNDNKIRKFLMKKFKTAGIANIVIERNSKRTEVFINASRPGLIIGQSGTEIENVKKEVSKLVGENVQISVVELKNPDLVAQLVADNIARSIENRVSFRVAQKKAIRNTIRQ
jgi:small subunit ribosomal protein S3